MEKEPVVPAEESYMRIFLRFLRFGCMAWGGPVAQIAMIRQELVEEEKWISKERFNRVLAVYQVLPGPEASELCVYFGMLAKGRLGGLLAGLGFMLPGFLLMLLFTWIYLQFGIENPVLKAVFTGFHAAVIALVFAAVHRIGKHALIDKYLLVIAIVSAIVHFHGVSFLVVLPVAGIAYVLIGRKYRIAAFVLGIMLITASFFHYQNSSRLSDAAPVTSIQQHSSSSPDADLLQTFVTGFKAGILTFGGAYTVIPFIQQDAVYRFGWMTNQEFLDGIALSGILPAPLIIFSTFVGYFASRWPGAVLITIAIYLPAFSFTLIGHNLVERVIQNKNLHRFLDGVTAGVIGLIGITALQLFHGTITDWKLLLIFACVLTTLYLWKSKITTPVMIVASGLAGWILFQL